MFDARQSLKDLLSNVDTLVSDATKTASVRQSSVKSTTTLDDAVQEVSASAKHASAELRRAAADRQKIRAEKVAMARHVYRTAMRLAQ